MSVLKVEVEAKIPETPKVEQPIPVLINNIPMGGEKGQVLTKKSGKPYDVAWENPKGGEGGGDIVVEGVTEEKVTEIVSQKTENLQPKVDESLPTKSKEIVGAITEIYNREDKEGLNEEQVKEIVQETAVTQESDPTVPDWAKQNEKPTYTYEEIKDKPEGLATEKYVDEKLGDINTALETILGV